MQSRTRTLATSPSPSPPSPRRPVPRRPARIHYVEQRVSLPEAGSALQPHPLAKIGATFLYYRIQETLTQQIPIPGSPGLATLGMSGGAPTFGVSGEFHAPDDIPFTLGIA